MNVALSQIVLDELALWYVTQHALSAYNTLIQYFGSTSQALAASPEQWKALKLHHSHYKRLQDWQQGSSFRHGFDQLLQQINPQIDHILRLQDQNYPEHLKQIADPPPFLFVRGNPLALTQPQIAMVGSRKPSPTGSKIAYQFAQTLAEQGFWISSGLAYGIDAAAHQGALQAGNGHTIAVLGTGVNLCYPSSHQGLYQHILEQGGCILSEFLPNSPPREFHFPRRNRIVSGLSLGVLVVEAALPSGSLITAQCALEQNRQVFAIPGPIYSEQSRGCHQLIRDGAILVDDPQQIIDELDLPRQWQANSQIVTPAEPQTLEVPAHLQPLYQKLDWVGQHMDDLIEHSKLDIATLSSQLMELELLGLLVQQGGRYLRCRV